MHLTPTAELTQRFLSFVRSLPIHTAKGTANVLVLQGAHIDGGRVVINANEMDLYNDTLLVLHDGGTEVRPLRGSVDPGRYYAKDHAPKGGAAHLTFGRHLYVMGDHPYGSGQPALRALNEKNRIWRDKDGDFNPDIGEAIYETAAGVNVHPGGSGEYVGRWSAGCINVHGGWKGEPWKWFMAQMESHFEMQASVPITVWRARDLFSFAKHGEKFRPTLVPGMHNPWVKNMQSLLIAQGIPVAEDGDWREKTTNALVKFQNEHGLDIDGWCGNNTWSKLLS